MTGIHRPSRRTRLLVAAAAALVVASALVAGAVGAAAGGSDVDVGPATGGVATAGPEGGPAQQQRLVVSLEPGTIEQDGEVTLEVTVANASPTRLRGVSVWMEAERADVAAQQRVVSSLEPGDGATFTYTLEDVSPGTREIDLFMQYTDPNGSRHGEQRTRFVEFERATESHPDVAIEADEIGPGGDVDLNLTVANGLNESIRSMTVELAPDSLDVAQPRRVRSGIETGETTTLHFRAAGASSGRMQVPVAISYTTASGVDRSFEETLELSLESVRNPARITLTELRVTRDGDRLTIRGSASNVGGSDATGVIVAAQEGDGVGPAESQSTFFVGEVPASDFSSFEVAAELRTNGSVDVPLRVSYAADDTRTNRTVEVSFVPNETTPADAQQGNGGGDGGGGSALPVVAVGAVVVLAVAVIFRRQFR